MPEKLLPPELTQHVNLTADQHRQLRADAHDGEVARVKAGKAALAAKIEAELLSFEKMLSSARDLADANHIRDRISALSRDLERARS